LAGTGSGRTFNGMMTEVQSGTGLEPDRDSVRPLSASRQRTRPVRPITALTTARQHGDEKRRELEASNGTLVNNPVWVTPGAP